MDFTKFLSNAGGSSKALITSWAGQRNPELAKIGKTVQEAVKPGDFPVTPVGKFSAFMRASATEKGSLKAAILNSAKIAEIRQVYGVFSKRIREGRLPLDSDFTDSLASDLDFQDLEDSFSFDDEGTAGEFSFSDDGPTGGTETGGQPAIGSGVGKSARFNGSQLALLEEQDRRSAIRDRGQLRATVLATRQLTTEIRLQTMTVSASLEKIGSAIGGIAGLMTEQGNNLMQAQKVQAELSIKVSEQNLQFQEKTLEKLDAIVTSTTKIAESQAARLALLGITPDGKIAGPSAQIKRLLIENGQFQSDVFINRMVAAVKGSGGGMLAGMSITDLAQAVPGMLADFIMPKKIGDAMDRFNQSLENLPSAMLLKFNDMVLNSKQNSLFGWVGKFLQKKLNLLDSTSLMPNQSMNKLEFRKTETSWTGMNSKVLNEVIPMYLKMIVAGVSGMPLRDVPIFDPGSGKMTTSGKALAALNKKQQEAYQIGALTPELMKFKEEAMSRYKFTDDKQKEAYSDEMNRAFAYMAQQNTQFRGKMKDTGLDKDLEKTLNKVFGQMDSRSKMSIQRELLDHRQNLMRQTDSINDEIGGYASRMATYELDNGPGGSQQVAGLQNRVAQLDAQIARASGANKTRLQQERAKLAGKLRSTQSRLSMGIRNVSGFDDVEDSSGLGGRSALKNAARSRDASQEPANWTDADKSGKTDITDPDMLAARNNNDFKGTREQLRDRLKGQNWRGNFGGSAIDSIAALFDFGDQNISNFLYGEHTGGPGQKETDPNGLIKWDDDGNPSIDWSKFRRRRPGTDPEPEIGSGAPSGPGGGPAPSSDGSAPDVEPVGEDDQDEAPNSRRWSPRARLAAIRDSVHDRMDALWGENGWLWKQRDKMMDWGAVMLRPIRDKFILPAKAWALGKYSMIRDRIKEGTLWKGITGYFQGKVNMFRDWFGKTIWSPTAEALKPMTDFFKGAATQIWVKATDAVGPLTEKFFGKEARGIVKDKIGGWFEGVTGLRPRKWFSDVVMTPIKDTFSKIFDPIKKWFGKGLGFVKKFFMDKMAAKGMLGEDGKFDITTMMSDDYMSRAIGKTLGGKDMEQYIPIGTDTEELRKMKKMSKEELVDYLRLGSVMNPAADAPKIGSGTEEEQQQAAAEAETEQLEEVADAVEEVGGGIQNLIQRTRESVQNFGEQLSGMVETTRTAVVRFGDQVRERFGIRTNPDGSVDPTPEVSPIGGGPAPDTPVIGGGEEASVDPSVITAGLGDTNSLLGEILEKLDTINTSINDLDFIGGEGEGGSGGSPKKKKGLFGKLFSAPGKLFSFMGKGRKLITTPLGLLGKMLFSPVKALGGMGLNLFKAVPGLLQYAGSVGGSLASAGGSLISGGSQLAGGMLRGAGSLASSGIQAGGNLARAAGDMGGNLARGAGSLFGGLLGGTGRAGRGFGNLLSGASGMFSGMKTFLWGKKAKEGDEPGGGGILGTGFRVISAPFRFIGKMIPKNIMSKIGSLGSGIGGFLGRMGIPGFGGKKKNVQDVNIVGTIPLPTYRGSGRPYKNGKAGAAEMDNETTKSAGMFAKWKEKVAIRFPGLWGKAARFGNMLKGGASGIMSSIGTKVMTYLPIIGTAIVGALPAIGAILGGLGIAGLVSKLLPDSLKTGIGGALGEASSDAETRTALELDRQKFVGVWKPRVSAKAWDSLGGDAKFDPKSLSDMIKSGKLVRVGKGPGSKVVTQEEAGGVNAGKVKLESLGFAKQTEEYEKYWAAMSKGSGEAGKGKTSGDDLDFALEHGKDSNYAGSVFTPVPVSTNEGSVGGSANVSLMKGGPEATARIMNWIAAEEGFSNRPYKDSEGKWTIGIGHLILPNETSKYAIGKTISDQEVVNLFIQDYNKHFKLANKLIPNLHKYDAARQGAYTAMTYQLGMAGYNNFNRQYNSGDFAAAANNIMTGSKTGGPWPWTRQSRRRAFLTRDIIKSGNMGLIPNQPKMAVVGANGRLSGSKAAMFTSQNISGKASVPDSKDFDASAAKSSGGGDSMEIKPRMGSGTGDRVPKSVTDSTDNQFKIQARKKKAAETASANAATTPTVAESTSTDTAPVNGPAPELPEIKPHHKTPVAETPETPQTAPAATPAVPAVRESSGDIAKIASNSDKIVSLLESVVRGIESLVGHGEKQTKAVEETRAETAKAVKQGNPDSPVNKAVNWLKNTTVAANDMGSAFGLGSDPVRDGLAWAIKRAQG